MERNQTLPARFDQLGKTIDYDFYPGQGDPRFTVIFIPGFKGFKDWGPWHLVAEEFVRAGFHFIKANLSHNGIDLTRDENEITDLPAFANNNFSIELDDISRLVSESKRRHPDCEVGIVGHSRGGALSILAASHDPRIKAVISWASPSDFGNHFFSEQISDWEKSGVYCVKNHRNGQDLPIRFQLYQDYVLNCHRLHIPSRVEKISQPFLAIHGDQDETVSIASLKVFTSHCQQVETHIIRGANHTFGARHPWKEAELPDYLDEVVKRSLDFLKKLPS